MRKPGKGQAGLWALLLIGGIAFAGDLGSWHIGIRQTTMHRRGERDPPEGGGDRPGIGHAHQQRPEGERDIGVCGLSGLTQRR
jgi:hypothetical protein